MSTPDKLYQFLTSLAPVTTTDYQIRGGGGELLYATNGDGGAVFPPGVFNQITRQVIRDNTFSYNADDPQMYLCGYPLRTGMKTAAVLLAYGSKTNGDDPHRHRRQLERHLQLAVNLIEENQSYQVEIEELARQLELSFEDLYLYSQISDQVKSLTLSKQMLNNIMVKIVENMHVDAGFITLFQRPQFDMALHPATTRFSPPNWDDFHHDLQTLALSQMETATENYIIVNDSRSDPSYRQLAPFGYRFLMVGVRHQGELFGLIGLTSFNLREIFRQGELRMLRSLAEQLAIVIANTDLYQDLEQFTVNMVRTLVHAIEAKDPYTRGHSERVHHFAMLIAKRLHLNEDDYSALNWAAILHDIGKIGISEQILSKPGKLTDEELARIKEHPEKGGRILKPVAQLADALGGVIHHHERYDGNGYPHGLKGEAIPLTARIIAVADTYDAIASNRTYRKAKSRKEALEIIQSVAGTQLDPDIVKIFEQVYTHEPI